jgi:dolichol kinase
MRPEEGLLPSVLIALVALLYNAILAPRLGLDRAYRHEGEGHMGGLTTYPLAVLLLVLLTPVEVAAGAWVVLAVLDPVAAAVGSRLRRPRIPLNARKSVCGTLAGLIASALACAGILTFLGVPDPWPAALCAAGAGAVAEALPLPIDDNLPIAAASAAALLAWL